MLKKFESFLNESSEPGPWNIDSRGLSIDSDEIMMFGIDEYTGEPIDETDEENDFAIEKIVPELKSLVDTGKVYIENGSEMWYNDSDERTKGILSRYFDLNDDEIGSYPDEF